jgi:hypothetical protein
MKPTPSLILKKMQNLNALILTSYEADAKLTGLKKTNREFIQEKTNLPNIIGPVTKKSEVLMDRLFMSVMGKLKMLCRHLTKKYCH